MGLFDFRIRDAFFKKHKHYGLIRRREAEFKKENPFTLTEDQLPPVDIKSLPRSLNISSWMTIESQDIVGSCSGQSNTSCCELAIYRQTKGKIMQLNRMFAYRVGQMMDGITGDNGATIGGSVRGAKRYGAALEVLWPYVNRYQVKVPAECFKDAEGLGGRCPSLDDPFTMGQRFNLPLGGGVYDLHSSSVHCSMKT